MIAAALKSGALDCGLLPPALALKVIKGKVAQRMNNDYELDMQGLVVVYNTKWAEANPDTANKFMKAYLRAARDLQTDNGWRKAENIAAIAKHIRIPAKMLKKINQQWIDVDNLKVEKASVMKQQQYYVTKSKLSKLTKPLPFTAIVDESYAEYAVANLK